MADWLYEAGIGENRAALVEDGEIVAARIELPGQGPRPGAVVDARLVEKGRRMARVLLSDGTEAMLATPPLSVTQGATLRVEIVREAIPERGRPKRAMAVPAIGLELTAGPTWREQIEASGIPVSDCLAHHDDALEAAGWSELLEEAATGEIAFPGGALRMSVTPAMTLFDVDGDGEPVALALAGIRAAARAILRHGIGGSIGIDLPTLSSKAERQGIDDALDVALPGPFERTATNGFGFLQVIRRRERVSLPELLAADRAGAAARALLRRVERTPPPGERIVSATRAVVARLTSEPGWCAELARRTGRDTDFVES